MAIGVVTPEEFEQEISKIPPVIATVVDKSHRGRVDGDNNVPEEIQKIIGETAIVNNRQSALRFAEYLGISPSSVSAYSNGATSCATYNQPKKNLKGHLNKVKRRIASSASEKLRLAMECLTEEKINESSAREISGVAKDMASIMKDMSPSTENQNIDGKGPSFVIYAPQFRQENSFNQITLEE